MHTNVSVQLNEFSISEHTHVTNTEIKNKILLITQSHNHAPSYPRETTILTSNSRVYPRANFGTVGILYNSSLWETVL